MSLDVRPSDQPHSLPVEIPDEKVSSPEAPPSSSVPTASVPVRQRLFINRNFTLLWLGQTISIMGDYIFDATLLLWIVTSIGLHQSWAPLAASGIYIMVSLPVFIVGPLAGVFVDRFSKRLLMMRMDLLRAGLILVLLLTALSGRLPVSWQLGSIYAIVLLASACAQFFSPARLVLIGDIVPEPARPRATGMLQVIVSLATFFGPILAVVLYNTVGVYAALAFNACSFLASYLAIRLVKDGRQENQEQKTARAFWAEFGAGWTFCLRNKVLRTVVVALIVSLFGIGSVNVLVIFFVQQNLHEPAGYYSFLALALGIGTAVGAVGAGLGAQRLGLTRTLYLALLAMGVTFFIFSRVTSFPLAIIVIALLGFLLATFNVALMPLVLKVVPRELVGRVAAMVNVLQSLTLICSVSLVGYLESTVLAHFHQVFFGMTFGPVDTIFLGISILVLVAGLYMLVNLARETVEG